MILPHGNTSIDDDNINLSNLLTGLLDHFIDNLAFLSGTPVDVDGYTVFLGNGLDGIGSVFRSVRDDDGRSSCPISISAFSLQLCDEIDIPSAKAVVMANPIPRPPP